MEDENDLLRLRSGRDSFMSKNVDLTLTSKILSHTSSVLLNIWPSAGLRAALDTKISKPPNFALVCNFSLICIIFQYTHNNYIFKCNILHYNLQLKKNALYLKD